MYRRSLVFLLSAVCFIALVDGPRVNAAASDGREQSILGIQQLIEKKDLTGARRLLAEEDVISLRFEAGAVVVETARPDAFYARLTDLAASGEAGGIDEVTSPDDNLQALFKYLVKA